MAQVDNEGNFYQCISEHFLKEDTRHLHDLRKPGLSFCQLKNLHVDHETPTCLGSTLLWAIVTEAATDNVLLPVSNILLEGNGSEKQQIQ